MTEERPDHKYVLLICSVGGTPDPIAAAIRHWRPTRVVFVCSSQTQPQIAGLLRDADLSPGCADQIVLQDPQDLEKTLRDMRRLDGHSDEWRRRGDDYSIVVDFTGGTKVMSAALASVARRWKCTFAYVGGDQRTKDGTGVVVSGSERSISQMNPWDTLGYQAAEQAVAIFNDGGYATASAILDGAMRNATRPEVKREISTLKAVMDAYASWDRFDHSAADSRFKEALKCRNDLAAMFAADGAGLVTRLERHRDTVASLMGLDKGTKEWVGDLISNARRRAAEGRYDDAVARLYRAFEALAQVRLREKHGFSDTKNVPLSRLPPGLRIEWGPRAHGDVVSLGLQDAYRLLKELDDPLGVTFADMRLSDPQGSPLVARNQSILAHGFTPVGKSVHDQLHDKMRELAGMALSEPDDWSLPIPSCWSLPIQT